MSQAGGISGLGIDLGSPMVTPTGRAGSSTNGANGRQQQQQQRRPRSMQLTESLNQFNNTRQSMLPVRRPTTGSERKVRIASGQRNGLRIGELANEANRYMSGPMNRNNRLGAAVAALGDQVWDSNSNSSPSDLYSPSESSSQTETTATSYPSGYSSSGSSNLRRSKSIRKQVSQPNLSRTSTMVRSAADVAAVSPTAAQRRTNGPPSPGDVRYMVRSKSSMSLAAQYRTETNGEAGAGLIRSTTAGSTSLGRTSEIPRSGSRASSRGGRGGGPLRGGALNRRATWDPRPVLDSHGTVEVSAEGKRTKADGFGGFIEVDDDEEEENHGPSGDPQSQELTQNDVRSVHAQRQASPKRAPQQQTVPPSQQQQQPRNHAQQHVGPQGEGGRPRSLTVGARPPHELRVGSFYGPDGHERARIDNDGRLSQLEIHRKSISESSNGPSEAASHQSSNASSRSSGPRPHFMASPATAQKRQEGSSVASGVSASSASATAEGLHKSLSMRSVKGFRGLSAAERGEAMVNMDSFNASAGYAEGEAILPGKVRTVDDESILQSARLDNIGSIDEQAPGHVRPALNAHMRQASAPAGLHKLDAGRQTATSLDRHGTLIASGSNPARRSKDLRRLLGNNNGKLSSSASDVGSAVSSASSRSKAGSAVSMPQAVLEQGRPGKGRVDVDLVLESELVVEGGMLTGRLEIKVRKNSTKDGHLLLSQPKVRVVGFEELVNDDTRHIFYHYATVIDGCPKVGKAPTRPYVLHGSPSLSPEADNRQPLACFASAPDSEGYCVAKEGHHSVPFALELPVGKGAKGSYRGKHAVVRYIVIGSVKLKSANNTNRSIAHFYRHIDLYPYLNPAIVLSSSARPVQARASKGLFLGGSGKVHLTASLHRHSWVAGQRLYVHLRIDNETNKKVKSLSLALVRTVILYRPRPEFDLALAAPDDPSETYIDPDACTTSTSRKKICEDVLEMGQKGSKGTVTARGWWTGVEAGDSVELSHNMKLPVDALTIVRGRHVEVLYSLKVSVSSSLSSDVSVELPMRIVNFVSLDPPPLKSSIKNVSSGRQGGRNAVSDSEAPMIARVRSMEALRSPHRPANAFPSSQQEGRYLNVARHVDAMQSTRQAAPRKAVEDLDADRARRLQHQKSLDFINHAIRSATARRGGGASSNEPSPTGLGIEVDEGRTPLAEDSSPSSVSGASSSSASEAMHPSCQPYQHNYPPIVSVSGIVGGPRPPYMPSHAVSLDEAGDDSDEEYDVGEQTLNLNDESVADIDFVIGSRQDEGGESSPEFSQRRGMEAFGGDVTQSEEDSDLSTSTITSNEGPRVELDEFDEEEERLIRQQHQRSVQPPMQPDDDGPTPIAKSPPKFQSTVRLPLGPSRDSFSSSASSAPSAASSSSSSAVSSTHTAETLAEAQREGKTVVRTRSDLEKRLGRSSTIIRGPSSNGTRPVSPSKNAPSPTKSALKSKSSFTYASSERPLKQAHGQKAAAFGPAGVAPLTLRAKVDPNQVVSATNSRNGRRPTVHQQASDSEVSSSSCSESSASPATSASLSTPREGMSDLEGMPDGKIQRSIADHRSIGGLGLQLEPVVQAVDITDAVSLRSQHPTGGLPASKSMSAIAHGTEQDVNLSSMHTLRGSNVVVPSVRDKIAMLESRKRALKELTGQEGQVGTISTPQSVAGSDVFPARGTPPASRIARPAGQQGTPSKSTNDPDTPTRVQTAARSFLERNGSVMSQASSTATSATGQPEYLRNMTSVQSFKAPLFRAGGDPGTN